MFLPYIQTEFWLFDTVKTWPSLWMNLAQKFSKPSHVSELLNHGQFIPRSKVRWAYFIWTDWPLYPSLVADNQVTGMLMLSLSKLMKFMRETAQHPGEWCLEAIMAWPCMNTYGPNLCRDFENKGLSMVHKYVLIWPLYFVLGCFWSFDTFWVSNTHHIS